MKTTFKELFIGFEDDLIDIPEESVCTEAAVDTRRIKKRVRLQTSRKRSHRKAVKIALIAASLAVVLGIFSTMIFAGSDIQIICEEFFGGSMNAAGLYDGGNVQITSTDPDLEVSFLGVTGDEHEVYAVLKAVRKDGNPLTEEDYLYPITTLRTSEYNKTMSPDKNPEELMSDLAACHGIFAVFKDRYGNNFGYNNDGNVNINSTYSLSEDRKTLKILLQMDIYQNRDARDGTMTVTSESFTAQKITRTILTDDHIDGEVHDRYERKCREMKADQSKCTVLYTPDKVIFCEVDTMEVSLPFEATFQLNYRYNGNLKKSLQVSDAPHFIRPGAYNVQMTVSPFSLRIDGEAPFGNDSACFYGLDGTASYVVMKDGTVYYFADFGASGGGNIDTGKLVEHYKLTYEMKPELTYFTGKILLDTRQIKQIVINGDIVYQS